MLIYSVYQVNRFSHRYELVVYTTTLDIAKDYILANIPNGIKIDVEDEARNKYYKEVSNLDCITESNYNNCKIIEAHRVHPRYVFCIESINVIDN